MQPAKWLCVFVPVTAICLVLPANAQKKGSSVASDCASSGLRSAPAPLFCDPIYDGAADPTIIWNREAREWWIFYTARRANVPGEPGVRWAHGTDIGIAASKDGCEWAYKGTAQGLGVESGRNTFWAPEVIQDGGFYHMFVSYVPGVHEDWSGERFIVHYTSRDLLNWHFEARLALSSSHVIDACVYRLPGGPWRMWYKDEAHDCHIYAADSPDLYQWTVAGPVITDRASEGPNVFRLGGVYWMLTDSMGLNLFKSADLTNWEYVGPFMQKPGTRKDDGFVAQHPDLWVQGDEAFIFYFVHPFGKKHVEPGKHRSVVQVARLLVANGRLVAERDTPFAYALRPPE